MKQRAFRDTRHRRDIWGAVLAVAALLVCASFLASGSQRAGHLIDLHQVAELTRGILQQLLVFDDLLHREPLLLAASAALLAGSVLWLVMVRLRASRSLQVRVRSISERASPTSAAKRLALAQDAVRQILDSQAMDNLAGRRGKGSRITAAPGRAKPACFNDLPN
jgi:hypothetical protein